MGSGTGKPAVDFLFGGFHIQFRFAAHNQAFDFLDTCHIVRCLGRKVFPFPDYRAFADQKPDFPLPIHHPWFCPLFLHQLPGVWKRPDILPCDVVLLFFLRHFMQVFFLDAVGPPEILPCSPDFFSEICNLSHGCFLLYFPFFSQENMASSPPERTKTPDTSEVFLH